MVRRSISVLVPIGIALVLVVSSLTGYHVLSEVGQALDPGNEHTIIVQSGYAFGELGLLLFGFGLAYAAMLRRERSPLSIGALVGATFFLGIACFAIGIGTWILFSAFQSLAAAAVIDADEFIDSVAGAKTPLLIGWCCAFVGATLISLSSLTHSGHAKFEALKFTAGFWLALISCIIFLLAIVYGGFGYLALAGTISEPPPYDPAELASGINAILLARFVTIIGIAVSAVVSILMAIATKPRPNEIVDQRA